MTDFESLSRRLQALEDRFRRIKALTVIAGIVIAAMLLMGQVTLPRVGPTIRPVDQLPEQVQTRQSVDNEIRARQIILVDDRGKERASLVSDNAGSVFLVMADRTGKARVNLAVSNDGPALTFLDPSGQARTILGSTTAVPSHVYDNGIAELTPPSSVVLFDKNGKLLFRTP
jgi:hypothetical protein